MAAAVAAAADDDDADGVFGLVVAELALTLPPEGLEGGGAADCGCRAGIEGMGGSTDCTAGTAAGEGVLVAGAAKMLAEMGANPSPPPPMPLSLLERAVAAKATPAVLATVMGLGLGLGAMSTAPDCAVDVEAVDPLWMGDRPRKRPVNDAVGGAGVTAAGLSSLLPTPLALSPRPGLGGIGKDDRMPLPPPKVGRLSEEDPTDSELTDEARSERAFRPGLVRVGVGVEGGTLTLAFCFPGVEAADDEATDELLEAAALGTVKAMAVTA